MIYTPRGIFSVHEYKMKHGPVQNPCACTKIDFKGYEISVSMDSSHGDGDLFRADIRVWTKPGSVPGVECTDEFLQDGENMLYGDADTLFRIMKKIEAMEKAQ